MGSFVSKAGNLLLKAALAIYLVVAFFVGVNYDRHSGSTVVAIIEGSLWPITLIDGWFHKG